MADKLARIYWQMGQTLLPEHLIAQEDALLSDINLRFHLTGLPFFGIGQLKWNDSLLSDGILSIIRMSVIMPSGTLLDVPGNAVINSFNMNVTGSTRVSVYLHLTGEEPEPETPDKDEEESVPRKIYCLEISSEKNNSSALETMKLADFEKGPQGNWKLSENYLPPLIQTGTTPFLKGMLDSLGQLLELFHYKLTQEIAVSYLSGESIFNAKQCLQGLYRLERFIANLNAQVHYHPYFLYEALKNFYIEVCLYLNITPGNTSSPYLHDDLFTCLNEIVTPLIENLQMIKKRFPYHIFVRKEGLFSITDMPKEVRSAQEVYFLIQKPRVNESIYISGLKLASLSRIPIVHQLALQGVPYHKIDSPPFQHPFGPEVEFFLISEGEEWDHVLKESTLAFYDRPEFKDVKAYIYWRQI